MNSKEMKRIKRIGYYYKKVNELLKVNRNERGEGWYKRYDRLLKYKKMLNAWLKEEMS